jgi:nucleoid DNA-binding protein
LTKKDIVRTISEEIGLTQQQTKDVVQRTFDAIIEALASERRIELRNFGVFEVKQRAARTARNPRTGVQVEVPEKFVVTFKPGKEMEARVNEPVDTRKPASSPLFPPDWVPKSKSDGAVRPPSDNNRLDPKRDF